MHLETVQTLLPFSCVFSPGKVVLIIYTCHSTSLSDLLQTENIHNTAFPFIKRLNIVVQAECTHVTCQKNNLENITRLSKMGTYIGQMLILSAKEGTFFHAIVIVQDHIHF